MKMKSDLKINLYFFTVLLVALHVSLFNPQGLDWSGLMSILQKMFNKAVLKSYRGSVN